MAQVRCDNCGIKYDPVQTDHTLEDCIRNLRSTIESLREIAKVYCNKQKHPRRTQMVWFEIDGELYTGGYDDQTKHWETSDGDIYADSAYLIYWIPMIDLEYVFKHQ